jgi:hypothetical protein
MLGKGIQQRGSEHVAGHAAERVEVNVHSVSVSPNRNPDAAQIGRREPKARDTAPIRRRGVSPWVRAGPSIRRCRASRRMGSAQDGAPDRNRGLRRDV